MSLVSVPRVSGQIVLRVTNTSSKTGFHLVEDKSPWPGIPFSTDPLPEKGPTSEEHDTLQQLDSVHTRLIHDDVVFGVYRNLTESAAMELLFKLEYIRFGSPLI